MLIPLSFRVSHVVGLPRYQPACSHTATIPGDIINEIGICNCPKVGGFFSKDSPPAGYFCQPHTFALPKPTSELVQDIDKYPPIWCWLGFVFHPVQPKGANRRSTQQ